MRYVVMMFEDEVSEDIKQYETLPEAQAFCSGVSEGAYAYGAGSAFAFIWGFDEQTDEFLKDFPDEAERVEKKIVAMMDERDAKA
jgi:hypothetical protein